MSKLTLIVLAQAIEDALRFELGLPLIGLTPPDEEAAYECALAYILRFPTLNERWKISNKREWLKEIEHARQYAFCKAPGKCLHNLH